MNLSFGLKDMKITTRNKFVDFITIVEIPEELEERVLEFIKLSDLYIHAQNMYQDKLVSYKEIKPIFNRFDDEEAELNELIVSPVEGLSIDKYFWELYED
jgi:hypothetical protein